MCGIFGCVLTDRRQERATLANLTDLLRHRGPDGSKILNRKKIGFRVPFNEWFRGPYRQHIRDIATSEASYVARICNGKLLRRLVDEHLAGRQNHEKILWSLANLEIFLRTFRPSGMEALLERSKVAHGSSKVGPKPVFLGRSV